MRTYQELYALVEQQIASMQHNGQPKEIYEPVGYMLSLGGKRLRPVLVLMGCEIFDDVIQNALPAALAVEVFHNFTLVHDDIMDKADIRRGMPTVHKKWNETIAILSGDLMMIKAINLLCDTPKGELKQLIEVFNTTAAEVCEGQQWDMNFETMPDVSQAQYIHMITLKTAVLLGGSLKLGALIGGASSQDANHLYEFGKNIGIAFQIQDDILDSFGEGEKVGKKIGGDIAANKKTLLLIEAMQLASHEDKILLQNWLNHHNTEEKINGILALYHKYDVRGKAEQLKQYYLNEAFSQLNQISATPDRTQPLKETAMALMERMS
ncbi:MAG: polyprenyl synthetase family protein [Bacteroidota bacterium]